MATMEKLAGIAQAGRAQLLRRVYVVVKGPSFFRFVGFEYPT